MKKYFVYELKKSGFTIACLSVICSIIYLVSILTTEARDLGVTPYYTLLSVIATEGGILAFCIPFIQFEYRMKKRSADLFFALPLSHTKIFTVKYLVGLIMVFAPYTLAYIVGALAVIMRVVNTNFNPSYYPLHFLSTLVPIYIIYAVSSFAYTRVGKALDGVLNAVCWATALTVIAFVIDIFAQRKMIDSYGYPYFLSYVQPAQYLTFAPLVSCTTYFANVMVRAGNYYTSTFYGSGIIYTVNAAVGYSLTGLMGIGATIGLFLLERRAEFEGVEQISKSPFGLRVMLPLFTVCIAALSVEAIELFIMFAIAAYLVTAYYKRTLKIGKVQTIILAVSLAVGLIIGVFGYYA